MVISAIVAGGENTQHVVGEFEKAGLKPAGTDGYLQPVRFRSRRIVEEQSSLALVRNGQVEPIALGDEATISMRVNETTGAPYYADSFFRRFAKS